MGSWGGGGEAQTDKTPATKSLSRSIFLDNNIQHCILSRSLIFLRFPLSETTAKEVYRLFQCNCSTVDNLGKRGRKEGKRGWKRLLEKCQVMERREVGICRMHKINNMMILYFLQKGRLAKSRCGRFRNGIEILLSSRFEIDSLCSLNVYKFGLQVFLINLPTLQSIIDGRGSESNERQ